MGSTRRATPITTSRLDVAFFRRCLKSLTGNSVGILGFVSLLFFNTPILAADSDEQPEETLSVTLDEVVVVATREAQEIIRIPSNVTVITSDDIENSTAKHITDLLRLEAGIMVTNTSGSTPTGITVEARGFNNGAGNGGRTLVLVDGVKANRGDSSTADWALIPLHNIERVEVSRGPATALYGDSAMASVISIITKRGEGKPSVEVQGDAGSYDRLASRATLQGSTDRLSYYVFASRSDEDGFRDNSDFSADDLTGKFSYLVSPAVELDVKLGYHDDDRSLPGALTRADIETVGRSGSVTPGDTRDSEQFDAVISADFSPNELNELSVKAYYRGDDSKSITSIPSSGSITIDDQEDDYSVSFKYTSYHEVFGKPNSLSLGVDLIREEVDSTNFSNFPEPPAFAFIQRASSKYTRELLGVYLHNELDLTDRLLLSFGARFDRADFDFSNTVQDLVAATTTSTRGDEDDDRFSPKAAVTYLFAKDVSGYFSYAQTFRFPNRDELTGFFGISPELKAEKGENFEVGIKARLGPVLSGGVSVYHLTVEDEIIFRPPEVGELFAFGQNENFEEVRHRGAEVSVESTITPGVTIYGGYTFVDTEITEGPFEGAELPITPRHRGNIGGRVDLHRGFSLSTVARFVGDRFLANDFSNAISKLPGYGVLDAKLSYSDELSWGSVSAFVGVNNILDKEYEEFGGIGGNPHGSRVAVFPSPDRNFAGGLTLRVPL